MCSRSSGHRAVDQVAGDRDHVGAESVDRVDDALDVAAADGRPHVDVAELRDGEAARAPAGRPRMGTSMRTTLAVRRALRKPISDVAAGHQPARPAALHSCQRVPSTCRRPARSPARPAAGPHRAPAVSTSIDENQPMLMRPDPFPDLARELASRRDRIPIEGQRHGDGRHQQRESPAAAPPGREARQRGQQPQTDIDMQQRGEALEGTKRHRGNGFGHCPIHYLQGAVPRIQDTGRRRNRYFFYSARRPDSRRCGLVELTKRVPAGCGAGARFRRATAPCACWPKPCRCPPARRRSPWSARPAERAAAASAPGCRSAPSTCVARVQPRHSNT